jgi:hypothetical protein
MSTNIVAPANGVRFVPYVRTASREQSIDRRYRRPSFCVLWHNTAWLNGLTATAPVAWVISSNRRRASAPWPDVNGLENSMKCLLLSLQERIPFVEPELNNPFLGILALAYLSHKGRRGRGL